MGMDFPIADLMDEGACYAWLLSTLHPGGLACPGCGSTDDTDAGRRVYRGNRAPVLDYKCRACGRVFNAFTGTALAGTHRRPSQLVLFLRGVAQGDSTARLARELKASRPHLHELRQRLQANAATALPAADPATLHADAAAEADECYVAAGENPSTALRVRRPAHRPRRPAAAAGEQAERARHVRQRPPAGAGHRRPGHRRPAA
jgi:transposase-like protein